MWREILEWIVWHLEIPSLLILAGSLFLNFPRKRADWKWLAFIFLLAFFLRSAVPESMRLFFDEDIYLEMGKNIARFRRAGLCAVFNGSHCLSWDMMKWPSLNPLYSSVGWLLGIPQRVWYIFLSSLIPIAGYLLARRWGEKAAKASSLLLAINPFLMIWGQEFAAENIFTLGILLTIFLFHESSFTALLSSALLFSYSKAEAVILLLYPAMRWREFRARHLLLLVLAVPLISRLLLFSSDPWGAKGSRFGLEYLESNLPRNLAFYLDYSIFDRAAYISKQLIMPPGIAASAIFLFRDPASIPVLLLFLVYASFYAGSILYGESARYQLGISAVLTAYAGRFWNEKWGKAVIFLLILSSLITMPLAFERPKEGLRPRSYRNFILEVMPEIRKTSCWVASHASSIYSYSDVKTAQMRYANQLEGCVLIDKGFWCTVPEFKEFCSYFQGEELWKKGEFSIIRCRNCRQGRIGHIQVDWAE